MPIGVKQPTEQTNDGHAIFHRHGDDVKARIGNLIHVIGDARNHAPTLVVGKICHGQIQQFVEQLSAHAQDQLARQLCGGVFIDVTGDTTQHKQANNRKRNPLHGFRIFADKAFVHQGFEQGDKRWLGRCGQGHRHDGHGKQCPIIA